jgi:hypothetical protein
MDWRMAEVHTGIHAAPLAARHLLDPSFRFMESAKSRQSNMASCALRSLGFDLNLVSDGIGGGSDRKVASMSGLKDEGCPALSLKCGTSTGSGRFWYCLRLLIASQS